MRTDAYKSAMFWKSLGVATIPVYYKSKQPKIRWIDYADELPSDNLLGRWFAFQYTNIAVITGWQNLCIIDFDDMAAFNQWRDWADEKSGSTAQKVLRYSRISLSARGVHIYIFCPDAVNLKLPGIDILASRKYALIPPSVHPSGTQYFLSHDLIPVRVDSIRDLFPADQIDQALADQSRPYTERKSENLSAPYDPWDSAGTAYQANGSVCEEIKRKYRIEDFFPHAEHSGGGGRWMIDRCPFHNDRNPSLSIDLEGQVCKCLSGHGCTPKPLDVIGLYAKLHGISNEEAITEMRRSL